MEIGIRYCGGCNSSYDRKEFVTNLIKDLGDNYNFETAKDNKVYHHLILMCGCLNCCLSHEKYTSKYGKIFIKDIRDYNKLLYDIKKLAIDYIQGGV